MAGMNGSLSLGNIVYKTWSNCSVVCFIIVRLKNAIETKNKGLPLSVRKANAVLGVMLERFFKVVFDCCL